jgi:hypothetical protein
VATVTASLFEYAVLRVVPRIERGEYVNTGVLLYCQDRDFLGALVSVDETRLRALHPEADVESVRDALEAIRRTCDGDGPAGTTSLGQRFRWLTAPRSTVVQAGPVHVGFADDPATELARLRDALVL